jgi:hypothetical protein
MKFAIALAAALTLGSVVALADDSVAPAAGSGHGACKADVQKFCAGVEHAKGKIHECLTQHQADLSDTCKQRMAAHAEKAAAPAAN